MKADPGSFRDPSAQIYEHNGRILRKVEASSRSFFEEFLGSKFFKDNRGQSIVDTSFVSSPYKEKNPTKDFFWLEHEVIDFITYPYEWGFEYLKKAALFHIELQKKALENGFFIKDSSAYNIQFKEGHPIFIDIASFEKYEEGTYWIGYKQFCENFLNPLTVSAFTNIDHNQFFRGNIDGMPAILASQMLPTRSLFSFFVLSHIHFAAWAQKKINSTSLSKNIRSPKNGLPKQNLIALWDSIHRFISKLNIKKQKTYWRDYQENTSYTDISTQKKIEIVDEFVRKNNLDVILDLGCNAGQYSRIALEAGASRVIGLDIDNGAVDKASINSFLLSKNFIALSFDLMNPSPAIGWMNKERLTLWDRLPIIDGVISLALVHHICIANNVPLNEFVNILFSLSNKILIEFVPKTDPMVQGLLSHRKDIFDDYNENNLIKSILNYGEIINIHDIEGSERKFFECRVK